MGSPSRLGGCCRSNEQRHQPCADDQLPMPPLLILLKAPLCRRAADLGLVLLVRPEHGREGIQRIVTARADLLRRREPDRVGQFVAANIEELAVSGPAAAVSSVRTRRGVMARAASPNWPTRLSLACSSVRGSARPRAIARRSHLRSPHGRARGPRCRSRSAVAYSQMPSRRCASAAASIACTDRLVHRAGRYCRCPRPRARRADPLVVALECITSALRSCGQRCECLRTKSASSIACAMSREPR